MDLDHSVSKKIWIRIRLTLLKCLSLFAWPWCTGKMIRISYILVRKILINEECESCRFEIHIRIILHFFVLSCLRALIRCLIPHLQVEEANRLGIRNRGYIYIFFVRKNIPLPYPIIVYRHLFEQSFNPSTSKLKIYFVHAIFRIRRFDNLVET